MSESKRPEEGLGTISGGSFSGTSGLTGALEALKARTRASTGSSFVEYLARRIGPKEVEITKFDGGAAPAAVYHVLYEPKSKPKGDSSGAGLAIWMTCDCPAGAHFRACKHLQMAEEFLLKEQSSQVDS